MKHARFSFEVKKAVFGECVLVQDLGPWDMYLTITNDAEHVIEDLHLQGVLQGRRVLYLDSEGHLDELLHKDGKFTGFAPGPKAECIAR